MLVHSLPMISEENPPLPAAGIFKLEPLVSLSVIIALRISPSEITPLPLTADDPDDPLFA